MLELSCARPRLRRPAALGRRRPGGRAARRSQLTVDQAIVYRRTVPRSFVKEARKRGGPKRQRIRPIIERLALGHADATIALSVSSPPDPLVSVVLSAPRTARTRD